MMSEWIEWVGGKRPLVGHVLTAVRLRNGLEKTPQSADCWKWGHFGQKDDIVAYRVVEGTASTKQHGGSHYADMPQHAQPWNVLKHWLTPAEYRGYQKGTAIAYLAREAQKGQDLDIRKALHHLERLTEEFDSGDQG